MKKILYSLLTAIVIMPISFGTVNALENNDAQPMTAGNSNKLNAESQNKESAKLKISVKKQKDIIPKATTDINEWMPDKNLQTIVLTDLQKPENGEYNITSVDQITPEMVANMKFVGGPNSQMDSKEYFDASTHVVSLKGLEKATNLEEIYITGETNSALKWYNNITKTYGQLSDISALKDLTKLSTVIFQFNRNLSDISALANKPKLETAEGSLSLSYCGIYDISPLMGNNIHPVTTIGFQWINRPLIRINSNAIKNGLTTPSFVISNLDANNVPVRSLNSDGTLGLNHEAPDTGDQQMSINYGSAATGTNTNDTTVKWTDFTKSKGYLTVRFDDPLLHAAGYPYFGWVMQPFEIDDSVGNVNVDYRLDDENGRILNPSTILAGKLGDTYDVTKEAAVNEIDAKLQQKYYFKEILGAKTGTYSDSSVPTVTYVYSTTPVVQQAAPVHVIYVDEANKEIADSYDITGKIGDTVQAVKRSINGYTFKEYQNADDMNGNVKLSDKERTVKVVYTKNTDKPVDPTDPVKPTNPTKPDINNPKASNPTTDKPSVKGPSKKLPQTGENQTEAKVASVLGLLTLAIAGYLVGKKRKKLNK